MSLKKFQFKIYLFFMRLYLFICSFIFAMIEYFKSITSQKVIKTEKRGQHFKSYHEKARLHHKKFPHLKYKDCLTIVMKHPNKISS
jgi:hypothetical protein